MHFKFSSSKSTKVGLKPIKTKIKTKLSTIKSKSKKISKKIKGFFKKKKRTLVVDDVVEADSDCDVVVEADSDCDVVEADSDCDVVEADSDPVVVEADSDCDVVEADSDCDVVEADSDPVVVDEYCDPFPDLDESLFTYKIKFNRYYNKNYFIELEGIHASDKEYVEYQGGWDLQSIFTVERCYPYKANSKYFRPQPRESMKNCQDDNDMSSFGSVVRFSPVIEFIEIPSEVDYINEDENESDFKPSPSWRIVRNYGSRQLDGALTETLSSYKPEPKTLSEINNDENESIPEQNESNPQEEESFKNSDHPDEENAAEVSPLLEKLRKRHPSFDNYLRNVPLDTTPQPKEEPKPKPKPKPKPDPLKEKAKQRAIAQYNVDYWDYFHWRDTMLYSYYPPEWTEHPPRFIPPSATRELYLWRHAARKRIGIVDLIERPRPDDYGLPSSFRRTV